jgi:hypothetical protein
MMTVIDPPGLSLAEKPGPQLPWSLNLVNYFDNQIRLAANENIPA